MLNTVQSNCFFLDLDLLVTVDTVNPDAIRFLEHLLKKRIPFLLLTDNTLYSRARWIEKFHAQKMLYLNESYIYTTAMAAADTIYMSYPDQRGVTVLGTKALKELISEGNLVVDYGKADWVMVGRKRRIDSEEINTALHALNQGAKLISLSDCRQFTLEGADYTGEGAVTKMLEYASGQKALLCRYNDVLFFKKALTYSERRAGEVCFVSNRLNDRILTAKLAGCKTALVTKGMDEDVNIMESDIRPDMITESLEGLI